MLFFATLVICNLTRASICKGILENPFLYHPLPALILFLNIKHHGSKKKKLWSILHQNRKEKVKSEKVDLECIISHQKDVGRSV